MNIQTFSRRQLLVGLVLTIALGGAAMGKERELRINLGTLAPSGSSFHQAIMRMGEKWKAQGVRLVVFPNGAQGSEAEMVHLMHVDTLQAGLFTAVGLAEIEPGISGLQNYPMLFRSFDELEYVTSRLQPLLAQRLAARGYVVLFWADAGWIRYFFKEAVTEAAQFRKVKSFVWAGSPEQYKIMREQGYNPVQMETGDILQGIATGQITGVSVPPIFALVSQFEKRLPHMVDLDWAPMVGACVVKKDAWDRLSATQRVVLQAAADAAAVEIRARNRAESDQAVARMQASGLIVHKLTAGQRAGWQQAADEFQARIRGRTVPAEIHDEVMSLLKTYRAGKTP